MQWNVYVYSYFREGWVVQTKKVWAGTKPKAIQYAKIIFGSRNALFVSPNDVKP